MDPPLPRARLRGRGVDRAATRARRDLHLLGGERARLGTPVAVRGDLEGAQVLSHVERNLDVWTKEAADCVAAGERGWAKEEITWGIYGVPEAELGALADVELDGADVVELGCGTAYFSAWFARRGARPVGVDLTPAQLET